MPQVIIVSNRLPVSVKKEDGKLIFYPSIGGLATGLSWYVNNRKNRWIGWPGIASDELTDNDKKIIVEELAKRNCSPVFLTQKQVDDFYNGYSNGVLWPLFHNLKRKLPADETRRRWWRAYRNVNELFAQAALNLVETGTHLWVHDYQLLLVPELLRRERADIISGFFLHIPFPTPKILQNLPEHKKLLSGMLGADVVGMHTPGYVNNFLQGCQMADLGYTGNKEVSLEDRSVRVSDFPMGIDYAKYASATKSRKVRAAVKRYHKRYKKLKVIVAIDRMDPSKGLVERLKAYATLLDQNPKLCGKVVFSMVAAPSRTSIPAYQQLAKRLSAVVGEINTKYGSPKWQPVDYIDTAQPFEEVTALFQIADVAFIAPISDGMNLAAKEFVASKRKNGVLILSKTAGAAEELKDALLVDPKRPETLVEALERALGMRKRELRHRLKRMQHQLADNTVQAWAKNFMSTLQQPLVGTPTIVKPLRGKLELRLLNDWRQAKKRLLLLDYDGTLIPFSGHYKMSKPPESLVRLLERLSASPQNDVVLISGRSPANLDEWFGHLPLNLVSEHGAGIKKPGKPWQTIAKADNQWKEAVRPILEKYVELAPGAEIESKPYSLVWHYRSVSPYYAQKYGVIIKKALKPVLKKHGLELMQGNKVLEVKNPMVNKGAAAWRWVKQNGYDFVLAVGDDRTDEDLFSVTPPEAYSIKVGRGRTKALYRLASYPQVVSLLKKLA